MPACSKALHPSGVEVTFTEENHKYVSVIDGKEIEYKSGTTFLHDVFPPFDPTGKIAERVAAKKGIPVEAVKAMWNTKRDNSCRLGTRTHEICEDVLLGRELRNSPEDDAESRRFGFAKEMASKFRSGLDILDVEKIVFSPYLPTPIAGTVDLLARSRKDGSYLILDWKTNEKIETENPWNSFCLEPISHLPDNNYTHYALQLSLYQYLLKFGKYLPADATFKRAIIHVTENGSKIYQLPDYTNEIKDIIIWKACRF